jgi:hypothetical protein
MKSPRKLFFIGVTTLALAAALVLHSFNLAATKHLESVQQELHKLLGLDIRFASLEVHLAGWPGFAAKQLRIADDPRFAATSVLRARELILGVQLWPLLRGRVVIDALTLREPELQIIIDESGLSNLARLIEHRKERAPAPTTRPAPAQQRPGTVRFAIDNLRMVDGRVIYLDRSVKQPAELQLTDVDLNLKGLDDKKTSRLRLAAALTEGLGQDLVVNGQFHAATADQPWLQREIDLTLRSDSLHVPVVARALAALRDRIPREVDISGPMSLQAHAGGSLARPRIDDIVLKAPLWGASDYNLTLTGAIQFSERRSWEDAEISGTITASPLPLVQLRNLSWLRQYISSALVTDGTLHVGARFEGTWETLRIGALIQADKSEWRYHDWLRKPLHRPAEIRARMARRKDKWFFHESEFASANNRIGFLGVIDVGAKPKLQLRFYSSRGELRDWREMILPNLLAGATGQTDLNVVIDRNLLPEDSDWSAQGYLKFTDATFNPGQGSRAIEGANGTLTFNGRQAKLENGKFRFGESHITLEGEVANLRDPETRYRFHAAELNLADLSLLASGPTARLKNFNASGVARLQNDAIVLDGHGTSPEGRIGDLDYRDLRAAIRWSAAGTTIKDLWLRTLDGSVRADGYLASESNSTPSFELAARADAIALRALMTRLLPVLRDRVEGRLQGHVEFVSTSARTPNDFKGAGKALVQDGVIKDFNLISHLLLRGSGTAVPTESIARLPPGLANLLGRADTRFDSLKADFTVEPAHVRTDNLVIATPDYVITGAGWIGFDRSTKWNGLIVLSPRLTQDLQRDMRLLRYLLDRRGRLAITFRIDGTLPNVRIRLDNRALAQTLRGTGREGERDTASGPNEEPTRDKKWLPDALERFLNR